MGHLFRALKVWFTLRIEGTKRIRENIRNHLRLARKLYTSDPKLEIIGNPILGLVCFRLKGDCDLTKPLLDHLTEKKNVYAIPAKCLEKFVIRFVVNGFKPSEGDINFACNEIITETDRIISKGEQFATCGSKNYSSKFVSS